MSATSSGFGFANHFRSWSGSWFSFRTYDMKPVNSRVSWALPVGAFGADTFPEVGADIVGGAKEARVDDGQRLESALGCRWWEFESS